MKPTKQNKGIMSVYWTTNGHYASPDETSKLHFFDDTFDNKKTLCNRKYLFFGSNPQIEKWNGKVDSEICKKCLKILQKQNHSPNKSDTHNDVKLKSRIEVEHIQSGSDNHSHQTKAFSRSGYSQVATLGTSDNKVNKTGDALTGKEDVCIKCGNSRGLIEKMDKMLVIVRLRNNNICNHVFKKAISEDKT